MRELDRCIKKIDFNILWDHFTPSNYAIYNDEKFYINDDLGLKINLIKKDSCFIGAVDERFVGNTAILIDGQYVAIWNEKYITENTKDTKLASLLIHEMFHCFQYRNGEKRFPNELLGVEYPITVDNISLRMLERECLLNTVIEQDMEQQRKNLNTFFGIRNRREKLIGRALDYEKAIESVEGIAVYVELKSFTILENKDIITGLKEYIEGFIDINQENLKIRHSTYNQGLLLGLAADKLIPNWKKRFTESDLYLSDFLQKELNIQGDNIIYSNKKVDLIKSCVINWEMQRDEEFDEFERGKGTNVLLEDIAITGFDPMNLIKRKKEIIHKNFLRIKNNGKECIIKGPVKTTIGEHIFDVEKVEW